MTLNKIPHFDPFTFNIADMTKTAIGFDDIFKKMNQITESLPKIPTYPPYNIRKIDDTKYVIEVAVAGFGSQDIEVEIDEGTLTIKGSTNASTFPASEYLFKGIADRAFTRKFSLADTIIVKDADLMNGMLKVMLERLIPEDKKPKKVKINDGSVSEKQFLKD
jgi:molecular chaperone IbpA